MKNPDKSPVIDQPASGILEIPRPTRSEVVGVIRAAREYRLVAICPIPAGDLLFRIEGVQTTTPTRYSLQIGENLHVDLSGGHSTEEILDRYFWRFMNHSCAPNSLIRDREVVARRDIQPWESVTFDYNTTEWDMAEPFSCGCGSVDCLGIIRGLRYLTSSQRERLGTVASHLRRHMPGECRVPAGTSQT